MISDFLVKVPKSLEYDVTKISKALGISQYKIIEDALNLGLLRLNSGPKKTVIVRMDRREYIVSVPARFEADISKASKTLGKWGFHVVAMALKAGLEIIAKAQKKHKHLAVEKEKRIKILLPKTSTPRVSIIPRKEPPQDKPQTVSLGEHAMEIPNAKIEVNPTVEIPNVPMKTDAVKLEVCHAKDYLHRYFCKTCDAPIDVPHSDYLMLKKSTENGVRLQCRNHGGYAHLLRTREKISA